MFNSVKKVFKLLLLLLITVYCHSAFSVDVKLKNFSESFEYISLPGLGDESAKFKWPRLMLSYDYTKNPLVTKNLNNNSQQNILIESFSSAHLGVYQEFSSRWALTLNTSISNLKTPANNESGVFGDTLIRLRYRFKETDRSKYALHFVGKIPTGDKDFYLSDESFGYGLRLQYERRLNKKTMVNGLLGYTYSKDAQVLDLDYRQKLNTSIGLSYALSSRFGLSFEWERDWTLPFNNNLNPNELLLALRYKAKKTFMFFVGAGLGGFDEEDSSDYRLFTGFKYQPINRRGFNKSGDNKNLNVPAHIVDTSNDLGNFKCFNHDFVYKSHNVFFKLGGFSLAKKETAKLKQLKNFLIKKKNYYIYIVGHADTVGGDEVNDKLSENRSKAVLNFLISNGFSKSRIKKMSVGESQPFDSVYEDNKNSRYNRRVQVLMFYPETKQGEGIR